MASCQRHDRSRKHCRSAPLAHCPPLRRALQPLDWATRDETGRAPSCASFLDETEPTRISQVDHGVVWPKQYERLPSTPPCCVEGWRGGEGLQNAGRDWSRADGHLSTARCMSERHASPRHPRSSVRDGLVGGQEQNMPRHALITTGRWTKALRSSSPQELTSHTQPLAGASHAGWTFQGLQRNSVCARNNRKKH